MVVVSAPPARAVAYAPAPRIGVGSQYTTEHLWNARHMVRLARQREAQLLAEQFRGIDFELRAYVVAAIFSAVGFLEGYVNGVWQEIADPPVARPITDDRFSAISAAATARIRELWKSDRIERSLSVIDKYQVALTCVDQPRIDMGVEPGQTVQTIIRLRNDLTHTKLEIQWSDEEHRLKKALEPRIGANPLTDTAPWFPHQVLTANCAQVTYDAVCKFADLWRRQMKIGWDPVAGMESLPDELRT